MTPADPHLPNLTTPNSLDQIGGSPQPRQPTPDPARRRIISTQNRPSPPRKSTPPRPRKTAPATPTHRPTTPHLRHTPASELRHTRASELRHPRE